MAVLILAWLGGAWLAVASDAPKLRIVIEERADTSRFPEVTVRFRLVGPDGQPVQRLPQEALGQGVVFEDGREVHRFQLGQMQSQPPVVVLAMDTSGSMERESTGQSKMEAAQQAAVRFFDRLDAEAPCGLVLFHHAVYHQQGPSSDRAALRQKVLDSRAYGGTAWYDAASAAIELLAQSPHPGRRVLVLMTDGRDVNSKRGLEEVIQDALRHQVTVYTIGLGEPGRDEPVRTVLVLDRSGSMQGQKIASLRDAAIRFVELMPSRNAHTCLVPFSTQVEPQVPFTNDRQVLTQAIRELEAAGDTALYDAIYEGVQLLRSSRAVSPEPRRERRSVVVLTDGEDTCSRRGVDQAIARAKRDEVKVHMLALGEDFEINEPVMRYIAEQTGGYFFRIRKPEDMTAVFENLSVRLHDDGIDEAALRRLAEETGGQYFHVRDADRLTVNFETVVGQIESVHTVTFRSWRNRYDGTARGIEIRLHDLVAQQPYAVPGLITPRAEASVYLLLLAGLLMLLAVPVAIRRGLSFRRLATPGDVP
jgi:VWFA-related protein